MAEVMAQPAKKTVEINCYLLEVCKEILQGPRFATDLDSSHFFCTAATKIQQQEELTKKFSLDLQQKLEPLFKTMKLSKLWPAHHTFSVGDQLEKDWKVFCGSIGLEVNPLFWQYVTEEIFKKRLHIKLQSLRQSSNSGSEDTEIVSELTLVQ